MSLATEIKSREFTSTKEKSRLLINVEYGELLAGVGLVSFAAFFHYQGGEPVKRIPDRTVTRITLGQGESFFLKRHLLETRRSWRQPLLGRGAGDGELSEGAGEFGNYALFRQRGLATAVPVAMGEREVAGAGMESFLLTRDFAPLVSLETIIRQTPHLLAGPENRERRRHVLLAAADYARRMHQSGVNHLDFNATHILLDPTIMGQGSRPQAAVFDLQRVASNIMASWRWPVKTLAELNFTLPRALFDEDDRLFMLAIYLGKERLAVQDRLLWRAIVAKTDKIERHTLKRWARRRQERAEAERGEAGPRQLLIHDQEGGRTEPLTVERILRQVPGSRVVEAGHWGVRPVIVKAFLGHGRQGRLARERDGLMTLIERGIDAPRPLFGGEDSLGRQALVLEQIEQAVPAAAHPDLHRMGPEGSRVRALLMRTLSGQHKKGVEQRDLHPGNFLLQGERVFALDPAAMRFGRAPLGLGRSLAQLAAMGALFPELGPEEFTALALVYAQARQWSFSERTLERLETRRQEVIADKLKKRLKKYGRANTRHAEATGNHYRLLVDRKTCWECREPEELAAVLREAARGQRAALTGRPLLFIWRGRQLAAYLLDEGSLLKRLLKSLFPGWSRALRVWQDLYRQQACTDSGLTPVALLQPRSPWLGLSSFVIIETAPDATLPLTLPTAQALLFPPRRS